MQKFARLEDGRVSEIFEIPDTILSLVTGPDGTAELDAAGDFQYVDRPMTLTDVLPENQVQFYRSAGPGVAVGWLWDGQTFSPPPTGFTPEQLEHLKTAASANVDTSAENARLAYITGGAGQALTYLAKIEELQRYDQDPNPVKADYPWLSSEIGITASSLTAVADAVRSKNALWVGAAISIERVRLKAKADILRADSSEKITGIVSSIEWP